MKSQLLSQEQLFSMGWKKRQIEAALDEPDETGPSGHWLNTSGKPFYDAGRVAVAAYRIGIQDSPPTSDQWSKWAHGASPTSLPILTCNFHRLAEAHLPGVVGNFRSLRISHPVLGRIPATDKQEADLIERCLCHLISVAFDQKIQGSIELDEFMLNASETAAELLGAEWPDQVIVRRACRRSYLSKSTSLPSIKRFIYALSLVHIGSIRQLNDDAQDFRNFLISKPRMRFDIKATERT